MFQSIIDLISRAWRRMMNWLGVSKPEQNSQIDSKFFLGNRGDYDRELKQLDMDAKAAGFNDCCNCVVTNLVGGAITSSVIRVAACKRFQNRHAEVLVDCSVAATCRT